MAAVLFATLCTFTANAGIFKKLASKTAEKFNSVISSISISNPLSKQKTDQTSAEAEEPFNEPAEKAPKRSLDDIIAEIHSLSDVEILERANADPEFRDQLQMAGVDFTLLEQNVADNIQNFQLTDTQFEWSQYEDKTGKSLLKDTCLELQSKHDDGITMSVVELPIATQSDTYSFGATFQNFKVDDNKNLGLIFDYQDSRNYKGLAVDKKNYKYFTCSDGEISVVKRGLVKHDRNALRLKLKYDGGRLYFTINNLEITKINNVNIERPIFGVFAAAKASAIVPTFFYGIVEQETEN